GGPNGVAGALLFSEDTRYDLVQPVVLYETVVRGCGHDKATWNWEASADQFAQVSALAASQRQVAAPNLLKRDPKPRDRSRGGPRCVARIGASGHLGRFSGPHGHAITGRFRG